MARRGRIAFWAAAILASVLSLYHFGQGLYASQAHGFVDFPIFLRQARSFVETGELYVDAGDPQAYAPGAAVYKYPPLYAMLLLPAVHAPALRVLLGHWLLQIALYAAAVFWAIRLFRPRRASRAFIALALLVALNYEPFFETLWRLQLETPLLLLLVGSFALFHAGRDLPAGGLLGLAVMLKVYPAFLLLYFAFKGRPRVLAGCAASLVLLGAASWVVIGPGENRTYATEILPELLREVPASTTENLSPGRYAQTLFGVDPARAKRLGQVLALPLLLASLMAVVSHRPAAAAREASELEWAMFLPLMLLCMPNAWVNYQLLLLPTILVLVAHALRRPRRRVAVLAPTLIAFALTLFYAPCPAPPQVNWPCASTPWFLGLVELPRALHDLGVELRILPCLLLWGTAFGLLLRTPGLTPLAEQGTVRPERVAAPQT